MFGQNVITGQSFFKDAGDKLLVTSIFLSLQGEGPFQGRPALFIRLTYCSLDCRFCDTWFDSGDWFSLIELGDKCQEILKQKYGNDWKKCGIVITGGEPTLQFNIKDFTSSCVLAEMAFTQIESNGILPIELSYGVTLVVSPKCSEKTNRYLIPHKLTLDRADCLKFIVSADESSPYHTIPDWAFAWQKETNKPIYISPMNMYRAEFLAMARQRVQERKEHNIDYRSTVDEVISGWDDTILDREKNIRNHQYAARYALDHGLFLTLQMQLYAAIA